MRNYIGTKQIAAEPCASAANVAKNEPGGAPGYAVRYEDGYQSWSPKDVFEAAYQPLDAMSFGHALVMLKAGKKVARKGWNGKGMWLILVPGTPAVQPREGSAYAKAGIEACDILPHIDMWTVNADGRRAMLPGWLASQSDMLADDWTVID
jgi:hypothetical protein